MITYRQFEEQDKKGVYALFVDLCDEEDFFVKMSYEEFESHLFKNSNFKIDGSFIALDKDLIVGFASAMVRDSDENKKDENGMVNASAFLHTMIVKKEYRLQGIGSHLLVLCEEYARNKKRTSMRFVFLSGINYPWYIPNTDHHMHPGMPCVRINSPFYLFLYHHRYVVNGIHEGFHLPLSEYEMPKKVQERIEYNKQLGLTVEIYDPNKHEGVYEFCDEIEADGNPGFANSIRYNLKREQPRPFLVALHNNKVCGWTGAMYVESTGRGHLDGITVSPKERKAGLGKMLFCNLCNELKKMGATYMTFFTGLENPARYMYIGAGFFVAQSFADMKKEL